MESKVDSWPPCRVWVEVNTPAGLPSRAPEIHECAGAIQEEFQRRRHVAETRRAAEDEPAALQQIIVSRVGRTLVRYRRIKLFRGGGHRRNGAQPGLHAGDGFDAAADLPGQGGGAALA